MGVEQRRRRFLGWVGGSTAVALAGCVDRSGLSGDDPSAEMGAGGADQGTENETSTEDSEIHMSTVFHFGASVGKQKKAVANVTNLLDDDSTNVEDVVVVANGQGIKLLGSDTSKFADEVASLIDRGVSFRVCENSMEAFGMTESDLIDGAETVPAGVGELTKLQARDGYAYIETP